MVISDSKLCEIPAGCLLEAQAVSLSGWYGKPMPYPVASALLARTQAELQQNLRKGSPCFQLHVLALICHDRLGTVADPDFTQLVLLATDARERALLELVQGQLLASRKLTGATAHLQQGFRLAASLLGTSEYFELLRRHELLACLPYADKLSEPQSLASLCNEAAVINRLRSDARAVHTCLHQDTVG